MQEEEESLGFWPTISVHKKKKNRSSLGFRVWDEGLGFRV